MTTELQAVIVIDYQNLHLVGHGLFKPDMPKHECLVHPLHYANRLLHERNRNQKDGYAKAVLKKVLVYRGLPANDVDPDGYSRNQAQKAEWEKDNRIGVQYRPLKYVYDRTRDGDISTDDRGRAKVKKVQEKGIDVLCSLALVRESLDPTTGLVILASQDTDLAPALDEVLNYNAAKVETASWFKAGEQRKSKEIQPWDRSRRIWNTRMSQEAFEAAIDRTYYA